MNRVVCIADSTFLKMPMKGRLGTVKKISVNETTKKLDFHIEWDGINGHRQLIDQDFFNKKTMPVMG